MNVTCFEKVSRKTVLRLVAGLLGLLVISWAFGLFKSGADASKFRTVKVLIGDIQQTVSASGTVQPEEVIDVGAQVAGRILSFGVDAAGKTIDYGSTVEEGTVLALIDDSLFQADVTVAAAQVTRAQAELAQLKARLLQASQDWQRAQKPGMSNALSQSALDGFRAAFFIAEANVAVGESVIVQASASLDRAKRNLSYCTIKSPVRGVIIDRRVNIGQTVVSSLNAPSLFLLAKDLTRLQIWAAVNEADIGSIHPGQSVEFSVPTLPGQILQGTVGKIRLNAAMTQNVVTYTVEILTENPDRKLMPYLTADVRFLISKHIGKLIVANSALRWTPKQEQISGLARGSKAISEGRDSAEQKPKLVAGIIPGILWVPDGSGLVTPLNVSIGASDNLNSEILSGDLKAGDSVVTGAGSGLAKSNVSNPFTPQMSRSGRGK